MKHAAQLTKRLLWASSAPVVQTTERQTTSSLAVLQLQARLFSTSEEGSPPSPESPPKKRRGRPPKAKVQPDTPAPAASSAASAELVDKAARAESTPPPAAARAVSTSGTALHDSRTIEQQQAYANAASPSYELQQQEAKTARRKEMKARAASIIRHMDPSAAFSFGAATLADNRPWHSGLKVDTLHNEEASTRAVGTYFDLPDANVVPEAEAEFYADPILAEDRVNQPNYGCKGVQAEFSHTGKRMLLHRPALSTLITSVATRHQPTFYLEGWTGSGKSSAMYALVCWARANGWVVMYVPSALLFTQGGRFYKDEEDGLWDTPEAARTLLKSIMASHAKQLETMKTKDGSTTLAALATSGLSAPHDVSPRAAVDVVLRLQQELLASRDMPTLVAVDDYNALYAKTEYHEPMHAFHRRPVACDEMRLVRGFRVLERDVCQGVEEPGSKGVIVAAPSYGGSISPHLRIAKPGGRTLTLPRFSLAEMQTTSKMYAERGLLPAVPEMHVLLHAATLINGNGKEMREYADGLLHNDNPLGVSLGYKAAAAARKQFETVLL